MKIPWPPIHSESIAKVFHSEIGISIRAKNEIKLLEHVNAVYLNTWQNCI